MRLVIVLALLTGCIVDHHAPPPDPQPAVQPRTCIADLTLDGSVGSTPVTLPLVLDTNGTNVCLHLDATKNLVAAHFAASTEYQTGPSSAFTIVLEDASYATLQDGWDVIVDDTPPRSFANLEWNAPLHQTTDAILWIRAAVATTATSVNVSLFEPFE